MLKFESHPQMYEIILLLSNVNTERGGVRSPDGTGLRLAVVLGTERHRAAGDISFNEYLYLLYYFN